MHPNGEARIAYKKDDLELGIFFKPDTGAVQTIWVMPDNVFIANDKRNEFLERINLRTDDPHYAIEWYRALSGATTAIVVHPGPNPLANQ